MFLRVMKVLHIRLYVYTCDVHDMYIYPRAEGMYIRKIPHSYLCYYLYMTIE